MSDIAQPQIRQEPETAKEVAGKSVGRFGLAYITGIVLIGVLISCVANAIKHLVVWHSNNPIPNPFRAPTP